MNEAGQRESLRFPNLIIFISSFCLMVLELVAGRIMAPYLGVSLYTWTSVIGIILAGISAGNYLGGRAADSNLSKKTLSIVFILSGAASAGVLYTAPFVGAFLDKSALPLSVSTFLFAFFCFFPASLFLGCISPMIVKFDLNNLERTGRTVGRIYAFSTLGSILGTFATGYCLIPLLGTKFIVIAVAVILMLIGFFILGSGKLFFKEKTNIVFGCLIIFSVIVPQNCEKETNYYCINTRPKTSESGAIGYVVKLDHLVHSFVYPGNEDILTYDYEKFYKMLTEYKISQDGNNNFKAMFLGGGGYTLPRYFDKVYPQSSVEVVEIDPAVTKFNYEKLSLNPGTKIRTTNEDARIFFANLPEDKKFDLIFGDAFNDFAVPYHLTTFEFAKMVKDHLAPGGYYAVNVIDNYRYGRFVGSFAKTLKEVFPNVYLAPLAVDWQKDKRNTFVLVAGEHEIDKGAWDAIKSSIKLGEGKKAEEVGFLASAESVDKFLKEKGAIILTDGYVPVDNFLAPVFNSVD